MEQLTFQNVRFEVRGGAREKRARTCGVTARVPRQGAAALTRPPTRRRAARAQCWDLGGQQALRASWGAYLHAADAVCLFVDSTDRLRTAIVKARAGPARRACTRALAR